MKKLIIFLSLLFFLPFVYSATFGYDTVNTEQVTVLTGNLTKFLELTDTPSTFAGNGTNCVVVNTDATALVFASCSSASGDITSVGGDGVYIIDGSTSGSANLTFVEAKLNETIEAFLGNGTFTGGNGDITSVFPYDSNFIIINNTASGDVYIVYNDSLLNDTISAIGFNGTLAVNSSIAAYINAQDIIYNNTIASYVLAKANGDITQVNPYGSNFITSNNTASGDVYLTFNDTLNSQTIWDIVSNGSVADNSSIAGYINAQDIIFNNSIGSYINAQDIIFNTTIGAYVLAKSTASADITTVTPYGNTFITANNTASGDVFLVYNFSLLNDTISAITGNGTYTYGLDTNSNLTLSSNNFAIDFTSLLSYLDSKYQALGSYLTSAVEKLNVDTDQYLDVNATTGSVGISLNETHLNLTIWHIASNGTIAGGSGDITQVNPYGNNLITSNNTASGDVYLTANFSLLNDTISDKLFNGTLANNNSISSYINAQDVIYNTTMGSYVLAKSNGDITAVFPYNTNFITINNTATGDVYIVYNDALLNDTINAFLGNGSFVDTNTGILWSEAVNGTLAVNSSIAGYINAQDIIFNNTMGAYVLAKVSGITWAEAVNGTLLQITDEPNLDVNSSNFFNPSSETTINDVNTTHFNVTNGVLLFYTNFLTDLITSVANGLGFADNSSIGSYINAQDVIYNSTMGSYVLAKVAGDPDQNLFASFGSDSGETTASNITDKLNVVGSGTVSTGISGDTITITGSAHTTDTSASVDCSGSNVLLGNGTCITYFKDTDTDTSINSSYVRSDVSDDIDGSVYNLTSGNLTVHGDSYVIFNSPSNYIFNNGTHTIWK